MVPTEMSFACFETVSGEEQMQGKEMHFFIQLMLEKVVL